MNTAHTAVRITRAPQPHASARSVEVVLVCLIVLAVLGGLVWPRMSAPSRFATTTTTVEQGQTLWALAVAHPVSGLTTEQTADLIGRINGIEGSLSAGSVVKVPAGPEHTAVAMR